MTVIMAVVGKVKESAGVSCVTWHFPFSFFAWHFPLNFAECLLLPRPSSCRFICAVSQMKSRRKKFCHMLTLKAYPYRVLWHTHFALILSPRHPPPCPSLAHTRTLLIFILGAKFNAHTPPNQTHPTASTRSKHNNTSYNNSSTQRKCHLISFILPHTPQEVVRGGVVRQRNVLAQDNTNFAYDSYYKCFLSACRRRRRRRRVVLRQKWAALQQRRSQQRLPLCAYPSNEKLLLPTFERPQCAAVLIDALRIDCRSNNNNNSKTAGILIQIQIQIQKHIQANQKHISAEQPLCSLPPVGSLLPPMSVEMFAPALCIPCKVWRQHMTWINMKWINV